METCGEKQQELRKNTKRIFPNVEDIWAFFAEIMVFVFISVIMHFAFPESPLGDESRDLLTLYGIVVTAIVALGIQIGLTNSYLRDQLDSMQDRGVEEQAKVLDKIGTPKALPRCLCLGTFSVSFLPFFHCLLRVLLRSYGGLITV